MDRRKFIKRCVMGGCSAALGAHAVHHEIGRIIANPFDRQFDDSRRLAVEHVLGMLAAGDTHVVVMKDDGKIDISQLL